MVRVPGRSCDACSCCRMLHELVQESGLYFSFRQVLAERSLTEG